MMAAMNPVLVLLAAAFYEPAALPLCACVGLPIITGAA